MRTAKYHDFGAFKVAFLFIILVILGLFVYNQFIIPALGHTAPDNAWVYEDATCTTDGCRYKICTECGEEFGHETIPATGHSEGAPKKEDIKEHTSTQGASYVEVVYCTICNEKLSEKKVDETHETSNIIVLVTEPTCHTEGSGYPAIYCSTCDKNIFVSDTLESIAKLPHTYNWQLVYKNDGLSITADTCTVDGCGHKYNPVEEPGYEISSSNVSTILEPSCINGINRYVATISYYGEVVGEASVDVELEPIRHHTVIDENGQTIEFTDLSLKDENGRRYYNVSTVGFYLAYYRLDGELVTDAQNRQWDENGFAEGVFFCSHCKQWIVVRVFNDLA